MLLLTNYWYSSINITTILHSLTSSIHNAEKSMQLLRQLILNGWYIARQTLIASKKIHAFSRWVSQSTLLWFSGRWRATLLDGFLRRVPKPRIVSHVAVHPLPLPHPPPSLTSLNHPVPTIVTSRISFRRTPSKAAAFVSDIYEAF